MKERASILGLAEAGYVHTHKWANYFARRGHRVHLVSFAPVAALSRTALDPEVTLEDWTIPAFHLKRFWITLSTLRRLRALYRRQRPDIVHVHFLGHAAWYAALADAHPLVISVMGGGDIRGAAWIPTSWQERFLTPLALRRSDLVACWSRNLARIVQPMMKPGTNPEVLVGGIDLQLFSRRSDAGLLRSQLGLDADSFVVLSARLFWPRQRIDIIVRAVDLLRRQRPGVRLLLIKHRAEENPDYERRVESLIDELGLRPIIHEIPAVPNEHMPLYYSAADCTVSIPDVDGTPMTVMESLACGTPVVISDLPDCDPDLFVDRETVRRVPGQDPAGVAEALLSVARDRGLAQAMAQKGRRMVEHNADYEKEMSRLTRLYEGLVRQ